MIIADTGFWVALANENDKFYTIAVQKLSTITEPLITTWPVMTEVCHLLLKRQGVSAELSFMRSYQQGAFLIFDLNHQHVVIITQLMEKYADLPMDLADASLIVLAEYLGHGRILSTDQRDFHTYRWKHIHLFHNVLFA
jgi:hypothetical protein